MATHCPACGRTEAEGGHAHCVRLLAYDPPRFCRICGFRLDVQVLPGGVRSSCRECRRRATRRSGKPSRRGDERDGQD